MYIIYANSFHKKTDIYYFMNLFQQILVRNCNGTWNYVHKSNMNTIYLQIWAKFKGKWQVRTIENVFKNPLTGSKCLFSVLHTYKTFLCTFKMSPWYNAIWKDVTYSNWSQQIFLFVLTKFHGLYLSLTYCFYNKGYLWRDRGYQGTTFYLFLSKILPVLNILSTRPCIMNHPYNCSSLEYFNKDMILDINLLLSSHFGI